MFRDYRGCVKSNTEYYEILIHKWTDIFEIERTKPLHLGPKVSLTMLKKSDEMIMPILEISDTCQSLPLF